MKLYLLLFVGVIYIALSEAWWSSPSGGSSWVRNKIGYAKGYVKGANAMAKAYKEANFKNSDKYFHARGNFDAAKHGAGGKAAAKHISDAREMVNGWSGSSADDSRADQEANKWGRNGGDPNKYRPKGLPEKYKRDAY